MLRKNYCIHPKSRSSPDLNKFCCPSKALFQGRGKNRRLKSNNGHRFDAMVGWKWDPCFIRSGNPGHYNWAVHNNQPEWNDHCSNALQRLLSVFVSKVDVLLRKTNPKSWCFLPHFLRQLHAKRCQEISTWKHSKIRTFRDVLESFSPCSRLASCDVESFLWILYLETCFFIVVATIGSYNIHPKSYWWTTLSTWDASNMMDVQQESETKTSSCLGDF